MNYAEIWLEIPCQRRVGAINALGIKGIVSHGGGGRDAWGIRMKGLADSLLVGDARALGTSLGARCTHVVCGLHPHFCEGNFVPTNWSLVITPCLHAYAESASSKNEDKRRLFEFAEETDLNKEVQIEGTAVITDKKVNH